LPRSAPLAGPDGPAVAGPMPGPAVVRMQFAGANAGAEIVGTQELPGISNYFHGNDPRKWVTDVPHHGRVEYHNLYPGVDLDDYGTNQRQLGYDSVVAPGGDPGVIRLSFPGVAALRIDAAGQLILRTPIGDLLEHAPLLYQDVNGVRQAITGRY